MKFLRMLVMFILTITLFGCGKDNSVNGYKNIQEAIMNMESYTADIHVTYISNKGESVYDIMQMAKKDGKYILKTNFPESMTGNIIMYDGSLIWHYNPQVDSKISVIDNERMERREINIFTFLENHLKSNDIAVETSSIDEEVYTILEAMIPSTNQYFANEKLWLNNKTNLPEKLIIYDTEGKERIIVEYSNFVYNPELEDSVFDIENISSDD